MPSGTPVRRVQAQLWDALRSGDGDLTAAELHRVTGTSFQTVAHRLGLWVNAGLVARSGRRPLRYRLITTESSPMPPIIDGAGRAVPRLPTASERLWAAMRVLKRFDVHLLMITAGTGLSTTRGYVGLLQRTGYVRLEKLGNPRTGVCSRYVLLRSTGRVAPRETIRVTPAGRVRQLVDANSGQVHDISRGAPSRRRTYRDARPSIDRGEG